MTTTTHSYTGTIHVIECANCHMDFGVLPFFERERRRDHGTFWCPAGHANHYPQQSDTEKLRAELARTEGKLAEQAQKLSKVRAEAEHNEMRRRAEKAAKTRLKNRIAKGICPCCKRHFANVHRHITAMHPEFVIPEEES